MNRGYVKLWRKSLDAGWLQNHQLWAFWSWSLMKATYKEFDQIVGFQTIHLMPGDFIFGRKKAAKELKISDRSIRTILNFLKTSGNLTIKTTNKFSIISIANWETYQQTEIISDQQSDQPPTSHRPATDHKQEVKEYKNKRNNIFIVPSLEEITAYCKERKNQINPQTFLDHYTGNGWMVGKNKMKDWKAVTRTWETRGGNNVTANTYQIQSRKMDTGQEQSLRNADRIREEYEAAIAASNGGDN